MLVHRCRFVECQPSSVQCLSLDKSGTRLAVGRENGAVEIWNVKNQFYLDRTLWTGAAIRRVCFLPSTDVNIVNLVCTIGLDGMLRMYDLNTLQVVNQWQLGAGAIWDMAILDEDTVAGSSSALKHSTAIACSCDDGTVRVVFIPKVSDSYPINSLLPPSIILRTPSTRMVSVATARSTDGMTRWIWTGSSDGKMFRFDVSFNDRTELGVHIPSTPALTVDIARRVIPWCIKVLPESGNKHNIAVGDSEGALSFWDGQMGTRIQQLKHHSADIVTMATDPSGDSIYCGSVDAGITLYQRSRKAPPQSQWVYVSIGRHHTHDIQAIAGNNSRLFTAGIDVTVYAHTYEGNLNVPGAPLTPFGSKPIAQAFGSNRVLVQLPETLQVWRLGSALTMIDSESEEEDEEDEEEDESEDEGVDDELLEAMQPASDDEKDQMDVDDKKSKKNKKRNRNWRSEKNAQASKRAKRDVGYAETHQIAEQRALLLEIRPQLSQYNYITCSAVSRTGDCIALSDLESTRIFYLKRGVGSDHMDSTTSAEEDSGVGANEDYMAVKGRRTIPGPSVTMRISEAGHLVRTTPDHQVEVYDLRTGPTRIASFDLTEVLPKGAVAGPAITMDVSSDAQWLTVGDANNNISVFNLDTMKYHSALPAFDNRHTAIAFQPGTAFLAISFVGNSFLIYDIENNRLSEWSKNNTNKLPQELKNIRDDQIYEISFHPEYSHILAMYTHSSIFIIDVARRIGKSRYEKKRLAANPNFLAERQREDLGIFEDNKSYRLIERYNPILYAGFVEGSGMAVIERPFRNILLMLPPPFYKHRFAT